MKKLPVTFTKLRFCFKQLKRFKNIAIYNRCREDGSVNHYEVIVIQSHQDYKLGDVTIPASETYPSSEKWGIYGWTYLNLKDAERKFEQLIN